MIELIIGCLVKTSEGDKFFNVEMDSESYPTVEQSDKLKDFLNENTINIIDEVVYCIDKASSDMIWEKAK